MSIVESFRSNKTEVRKSGIQGKGLFAINPIKKGEIVAIKVGHIFTLEEFKNLPIESQLHSLQIEDDFFLAPKSDDEVDGSSTFINHSCEPNVGFDGQVTYIAIRDIREGEEFAHDYAMSNTTDVYSCKCNCGSKNCRGTVCRGDEWKSKELQNKYGKYFAWFVLKKIKQI